MYHKAKDMNPNLCTHLVQPYVTTNHIHCWQLRALLDLAAYKRRQTVNNDVGQSVPSHNTLPSHPIFDNTSITTLSLFISLLLSMAYPPNESIELSTPPIPRTGLSTAPAPVLASDAINIHSTPDEKSSTKRKTLDEKPSTLHPQNSDANDESSNSGAEHVPTEGKEEEEEEEEEEAQAAQNDAVNEGMKGFKLYIVVFALVLTGWMMTLNASFIATAAPTITTEFHRLQDLAWYGTAYLLCNCALLPLSGKFYQNLRLKWTFLTFITIFEIGVAIAGAAQSSRMLIVGRAVSGAGASGLMNGAVCIITSLVPLHRRPSITGLILSMTGVGTVLGPVVGGVLTEQLSWRWCFYFTLIAGIFPLTFMLIITIPEPRTKTFLRLTPQSIIKTLDLTGFLLFLPPCLLLLLALFYGSNSVYAWDSPTIICMLVFSLVTAIIFLFWERKQGVRGILPFQVWQVRQVAFACTTSFMSMGPLFMLSYYLPVWFQSVKGLSPQDSGVRMLPLAGAQMITSIVSGNLIQRVGYYTPLAILGSATSAIGTGLMSTFTPGTSNGHWIGYEILIGAGRGTVTHISVLAVQANLPQSLVDIGSTAVVLTQYTGGMTFLALAQTIFDVRLRAELAEHVPSVDPRAVLDAGALGIKTVFSGDEYRGVVLAYNEALTQSFYLASAGSTIAFFTSFGLGWKSIKKQKGKGSEQQADTKV
ncbi:hypothetical protein MKZ38_004705 [Zalerion maritima]|uniref:Major facilitator superfamily (MFS) profile domain-containing protein n=1 Tax=Zalerion maritima TaxID=339359 RepID=A0AAD5WRG2_9PEZI|nr:hypothetical protein MKZ38_004705 [Zalerion maritima]